MGKLPIYLISALVVLSMAFLLLRSLIFPEASSSSAADQKIVHYSSPSGLWTVNFLGEPKYSTNVFRDDIGLPTVTIEGATLDQGGELYVVRVYHYHDQEKLDLKQFLDSVITTWGKQFPTLKSIRQNPIKFQNLPALSFTLGGENLEMLGVVFSMEDYFYLISWVGNMNDKELEKIGENHFNAFLHSFQPLPPQ